MVVSAQRGVVYFLSKQYSLLTTAPPLRRLQLFRARITGAFAKLGEPESVELTELLPSINEGLPTEALFGRAEAIVAAGIMTDAEEIMYSEGTVYRL
jgi:DNA replication licensing factor MCM3